MYGLPTIRGITGSSIRVGALGALNRLVYDILSTHPKFGIFKDGAAAVDVDTVLSMDHSRASNVPDYRLQNGGFASYNKIQNPAQHRVTIIKAGSEMERAALVEWLEKNVNEPTVYDVVSNEKTFKSVTLVNYRFNREAPSGTITRLVVDCDFREIRNVEAVYYNPATQQVDTSNSQRTQDKPTAKTGFCQTLDYTPKIGAWNPTNHLEGIQERLQSFNIFSYDTSKYFDNYTKTEGIFSGRTVAATGGA